VVGPPGLGASMGTQYGQLCPVAKAMELLDERWTMLIVRELICGSTHFNALRRGVPRISPARLSKRLQTLVRAGVVERWVDGNRVTYRLTDAGRELAPIVESLGRWGIRWIPELGDEDLDPQLLLWDIHRNIDTEAVPDGRTVIAFVFPDVAPSTRRWWLVISHGGVDVCDADPGHPVRVTVEAPLRTLVRIWRGDVGWAAALRDGELVLHGEEQARRALPRWLKLSTFAGTPRPVPAAVG
jgi:DNA-binding HxlR family transcriptional regulator